MKTLALLLCLLLTPAALAQTPSGDNPTLNIVWPFQNGPLCETFVIETNIVYQPELATDPREAFAVGTDAQGGRILFGHGHIHGWVFAVDRWGRKIRDDDGVPSPASYIRFYGAGGAEFYQGRKTGYYVKTEKNLPRGRYKAFFQAQQDDHTAMLQRTAPAFPAIDSVTFYVW